MPIWKLQFNINYKTAISLSSVHMVAVCNVVLFDMHYGIIAPNRIYYLILISIKRVRVNPLERVTCNLHIECEELSA